MATPNRVTFEVHLDAPELCVRQRVGLLHRSTLRTDIPAAFEQIAAQSRVLQLRVKRLESD